jgi:hypothetical protein
MQRSVFNCATIGVVNRTDIRGRGTDDEMNPGCELETSLTNPWSRILVIA